MKVKELLKEYSLLNSKTSGKWKRIGIKPRAGVALPLFSIYSKKSIGIGEIPDLRYVIDWCNLTGMSVLQLLPLNEVGNDFAPYNALSTFALEPMCLSLAKLKNVDLKPFRKELRILKKKFPAGKESVDYNIKNAKLLILRKMFDSIELINNVSYQNFVNKNIHWLKYFALFKVLSNLNYGKNWHEWELKYKYISMLTVEKILNSHPDEINFQYWLQWQLYEQLTAIKKYAKRKKIFIMGDLPFLVSRNSADVWAYKNYFKLNLSSGAPPDMYFSKGQCWGMPPYNWDNIAADKYVYITERLKYSENFYDMFRIDHFVGLFRVWTIDLKTPEEYGGLYGKFDPEEEIFWEDHGRRIISVMNESTTMLPCAEDLGTVPKCSGKVLKEFGIPGMNVQRWEKTHGGNVNFLAADEYRINSVATVSTHDSSTLPVWWENEAGTIDELSFKLICEDLNIKGNDYLNLLDKLFDKKFSSGSRLFWKKEISNVYVLLEVLRLNYGDAKKIIDMYLSSFNEKNKFLKYIGLNEKPDTSCSVNFIKKSLEKISSTNSIFSIQLMMEYFYLDKDILKKNSGKDFRINLPGTVSDYNWSLVMPVSLEDLKEMKINEIIKDINLGSERI